MKRWPGQAAVFLLALLAGAGKAGADVGWNFSSGNNGWIIREGAQEIPAPRGWAVAGAEKASLLSPGLTGLNAEENYVIRLRLRTDSPRRAVFFWQNDAGEIDGTAFLIRPSNSPRTLVADLGRHPRWKGRILRTGISLEGPPGRVELHGLKISPFQLGKWLADQWRTFTAYRGLTPGTINGLSSPLLLGRPSALFFNGLAAAVLIAGALAAWRGGRQRRARYAALTGGVLLIVWISFDLRETREQAALVGEVCREFLAPPAAQRTFPGLGDLYRFADFCERHIPEGSVFELIPYPCWPYDCRLKYLLYPSLLLDPSSRRQLENVRPRYRVVRPNSDIFLDPGQNRLYSRREGRFISGQGRLLARYGPGSFIFVEEER